MVSVVVKQDGALQKFDRVGSAFGDLPESSSVLFVCPHDDDSNVGAGMTICALAQEGYDVHVAIVSDGRMGYCDPEHKDTIVVIRGVEAYEAYSVLGVKKDNIHMLRFPDCSLNNYLGRRPAKEGEPQVAGFTGIENSLTSIIRKVKPVCVFTPADSDLHPDHQAVYKELMISLFHASGDIWPELGEPWKLPQVYEFPIYAALNGEPDMMVKGDDDLFGLKLDSIAAFASQKQISSLVDAVRKAGPVEFLRNKRFALYDPSIYESQFEM